MGTADPDPLGLKENGEAVTDRSTGGLGSFTGVGVGLGCGRGVGTGMGKGHKGPLLGPGVGKGVGVGSGAGGEEETDRALQTERKLAR